MGASWGSSGVRVKASVRQTLGQPGFILADLPLDGGHRRINGSHHIRGGFLRPEVGVAGMNGKLNAAIPLFHSERNQCLSIAAEVALQLANLFSA